MMAYQQGAFAQVAATFSRSPKTDVIYGDCLTMDSSSQVLGPIWPPRDFLLEDHLLVESMVPQSSCFWRREAFERIGALREDLHVFLTTSTGPGQHWPAASSPRIDEGPVTVSHPRAAENVAAASSLA